MSRCLTYSRGKRGVAIKNVGRVAGPAAEHTFTDSETVWHTPWCCKHKTHLSVCRRQLRRCLQGCSCSQLSWQSWEGLRSHTCTTTPMTTLSILSTGPHQTRACKLPPFEQTCLCGINATTMPEHACTAQLAASSGMPPLEVPITTPALEVHAAGSIQGTPVDLADATAAHIHTLSLFDILTAG